MRRHILWFGLAIGCAGVTLAGCESHRRLGVRSEVDDSAKRTSLPTVEDDEDGPKKPAGPANFFKPGRLSGAMSSEGADIERSLGVQ